MAEGEILNIKQPYLFREGETKGKAWFVWSVGIQLGDTTWHNGTGFGSKDMPPPGLFTLIDGFQKGDYVQIEEKKVRGNMEIQLIKKVQDPFRKPTASVSAPNNDKKRNEFRTPSEITALELLREANILTEKMAFSNITEKKEDYYNLVITNWGKLADDFKKVVKRLD